MLCVKPFCAYTLNLTQYVFLFGAFVLSFRRKIQLTLSAQAPVMDENVRRGKRADCLCMEHMQIPVI